MALGAEQTSQLARDMAVPQPDDSHKYVWDPAGPTILEAIFTEKGFVAAGSAVGPGVDTVGLILRASPFYSEAGGQVPDSGTIEVTKEDGSTVVLDVIDVQVSEPLFTCRHHSNKKERRLLPGCFY